MATGTMENAGLRAATAAHPRSYVSAAFDAEPTILQGTNQILGAMSALDELRCAVGQQHDLATDLYLILSRHNSVQRRVVVVLLRKGGVLRAAVIFAERCVMGVGIGLLRAGDQTGDGTVIALPSERKDAMVTAMDALLAMRRCHTVAATLSGTGPGEFSVRAQPGTMVESEFRVVRRYMPLGVTLDETLRSRFTVKKRKNLLYYQRALFKQGDVQFVPRVEGVEAREALVQLARHSWPKRSELEITFHCEFLARHAESFCMGLRRKDGTWLSLITGWRLGGVTHMPWQMNDDRYKNASLMQVMRTCMLEHECGLGQTAVSWVGGTVSFKTGCEAEFSVDVLKQRHGVAGTVLRRAIVPLLLRRDANAFMGGSLMLLLPRARRAAECVPLDPDS